MSEEPRFGCKGGNLLGGSRVLTLNDIAKDITANVEAIDADTDPFVAEMHFALAEAFLKHYGPKP